jgi:hypothetical protein
MKKSDDYINMDLEKLKKFLEKNKYNAMKFAGFREDLDLKEF